jgi:hypothetical protein
VTARTQGIEEIKSDGEVLRAGRSGMQFALKGRGGAEISYEDLLGRLTGGLLWGLRLAGTRSTRFARELADNGDLKQMCCGAALRTRKQPSPLKRRPGCNSEMLYAAQHIAIPARSARMRA